MAAPNFQLSFDTGKQLKHLSPEGKEKVFRSYMNWFEQARKRNTDYYSLPYNTDNFSESEHDCLSSMIDNTCTGLNNYWSRSQPQNDDGQAETVSDCPALSEAANKIINKQINELNNEGENKNERTPESGLIPPSVEDVRRYAQENGLPDDSDAFVTYYTAHDWKHSDGQPLTSFEASYRMWIIRGKQFKEKERAGKVVPANNYHQREYSEKDMAAILGVDDLYKE